MAAKNLNFGQGGDAERSLAWPLPPTLTAILRVFPLRSAVREEQLLMPLASILRLHSCSWLNVKAAFCYATSLSDKALNALNFKNLTC